MRKLKIKQKAVVLMLAVIMLLQPFYGIKTLAEGETPTPTPSEVIEPTAIPVIEAVNENTQPENIEPTVTPGSTAEAGETDLVAIVAHGGRGDGADGVGDCGAMADGARGAWPPGPA